MMNSLLKKMKQFVLELGGELGDPVAESLCKKLPLFASAPYDFCRSTLFGRDCLIAMNKGQNQPTPKQIIAQKKVIEKLISGNILFVFSVGTKEFCQCLIKAQVPFMIPGRQIFFPDAMIAIREEKFNLPAMQSRDYLSPWAQVILLYHLLNKGHGNELSFQFLLDRLKINKVYLSRSAKELEQTGVAKLAAVRRMKTLVFVFDRHSIWDKMQEKLTSPVIKRVRIENPPENTLSAGISALSEYSLLEDDAEPTYAVYGRGVKFNKNELLEFSGVHLELWKYDPRLLSIDGKTVDKLSLYLSLRNEPDPRVAGELQNMMESFEW